MRSVLLSGRVSLRAAAGLALIALFLADGSHSARKKFRRPHSGKTVKEEKPPPGIEWTECGEGTQCIYDIFRKRITTFRVPEIRGKVIGFASTEQRLYLLVRDFNRICDAVFVLDRGKGSVRGIWGLRTYGAVSMTREGESLWIIGSSERYFIRKIDLAGRAQEYHSIQKIPPGIMTGIGVCGGKIYFSTVEKEGSKIYRYDPASRSAEVKYSVEGAVTALVSDGVRLYASRNHPGRYGRFSLIEFEPERGSRKFYRYSNTRTDSLAWDGDLFLVMHRKKKRELIYPMVFQRDRGTVLVRPLARKIKISYTMNVVSLNKTDAQVWIALPRDLDYQHVRKIEVHPTPAEIKTDRWGNRWARVAWDKVSGRMPVTVEFEMLNCTVAQTTGEDWSDRPAGPADESLKEFLGPTYVFDSLSSIVKSHSSKIALTGGVYDRANAIGNYLLDSLSYSSDTKKWGKASTYLYKGRAGVYGYCVSFIALARANAIAARAVGAITIGGPRRSGERAPFHAWAQFHCPGKGWVDMDIPAGMGTRETRTGKYHGFRSNRFIVTFTGDFDKRDCLDRFARKSWVLSRVPRPRGSSIPWVALEGVSVQAWDLKPR